MMMDDKQWWIEHIATFEDNVAEKQEILDMAVRENMDDETVSACFKDRRDAQAALEAELAKPAKRAQELAEAAQLKKAYKDEKALATARRITVKRVRDVEGRYNKVERYCDLLVEGFNQLVAAAERAYADAPVEDKPKAGEALYRRRDKLQYAITVMLYRAGVVKVLPQAPPAPAKALTPKGWAEGGGMQLMPKDGSDAQ